MATTIDTISDRCLLTPLEISCIRITEAVINAIATLAKVTNRIAGRVANTLFKVEGIRSSS